MIKVIVMVKRKSGLSIEEFSQYWYEKHAPLALRMTLAHLRPKRYVHNYSVHPGGVEEPAFDGIAELYFDDMETLLKSNEWYLGDEGKVLRDDEEKFVDTTTRVASLVEERVIVP
jgi:uncharacterized protein (TIGR02118 family)